MLKVAAVVILFLVGAVFAIGAAAWADVPQIVTKPRIPPPNSASRCCSARWPSPGPAAGRTSCSRTGSGTRASAWAPTCRAWSARSPAQPEAAPSTGYVFEPTADNLRRWRGWWRFANIEQLTTFVLITFLTILFTSLLAYSTVFGQRGPGQQHRLPQDRGRGPRRPRRLVVPVLLLVRSAPSRCSPRRWASSTTPAGSPPTSSRPPTPGTPTRARSTPASSGAWS